MDSTAFTQGMEDLQDHFGKRLRDARHYWDGVKQIPNEAWEEIVAWRIKTHAPMPGQFPTIQQLVDAYCGPEGWLDRHPEKKAVRRVEPCRYCEPDAPGMIVVEIPLAKPIYEKRELNVRRTVVRCGHCRNWEDRLSPSMYRMTRGEIEARGWTIVTMERNEERPESTRRVPDDITDGIGEPPF